MTRWRMARSLDVALNEVNRAAPGRSKASDGGIGDAAHATRSSDHNPWVHDNNGVGVVRARDYTHDPTGGFDAGAYADHVAELLGHHPALGSGAYVIWNRRIISTNRYHEGWRDYTGTNPHTKHVHVSVGTTGYDNTTPWGWEKEEDTMTPKQEKLLRDTAEGVERIQRQLEHERARDVNAKDRDRRRHRRIKALLVGVPAETLAAVDALFEQEAEL